MVLFPREEISTGVPDRTVTTVGDIVGARDRSLLDRVSVGMVGIIRETTVASVQTPGLGNRTTS